MAAPRPKPAFTRAASLDALANALCAAGDSVPRRLVAHSTSSCTCAEGKGGAPPSADFASCAPGTLFVHPHVPHRYEADDALRLHGLHWRARTDVIYYSWASFDAAGATHLDTERALAAAWAAAVHSQRWDIDAAACLGHADAALRFNAATALVLIPRADVELVVARCVAALQARGAGAADDRVVALGSVPFAALVDAAADARGLRRAVTWVGCARDEALALPLVPAAEGAPPATHVDKLGHHVSAVRALHAAGQLPAQPPDTSVLVMLQNFTDIQQAYIDVPGGGRHCGETSADSVRREMDEETGLGGAAGVVVEESGLLLEGRRAVHIFRASASADRDEPFPITRASGRVLAGSLTRARAPAPTRRVALLLHGMIANRDHTFAPALAHAIAARAHVHVLRFDFRAPQREADPAEPAHRFRVCGFTDDVDDVHAAVAALAARGLEPCAVIGHSRGAVIGLLAGLACPLVMIAPRFDTPGMLRIFRNDVKALDDGAPSFMWKTRVADVLVTREDIDAIRGAADMVPIALAAMDASLPLLVVHGDADTVVPVENAASYAAARPSTKVVIVKRAKHSFETDDATAALIESVVPWLESLLCGAQ